MEEDQIIAPNWLPSLRQQEQPMNAFAKDFMSDVARRVTTHFLDKQSVPQAR